MVHTALIRQKHVLALVWGLLLLSNFGLAQNRPPLVAQMGWADTILVNGKIVSMDDRSIVPKVVGKGY